MARTTAGRHLCRAGGWKLYFPLGTSILISIVVSIILTLLFSLFGRR